MSNYKSTEILGESWQRASRVVIENPYQLTPMIHFVEEKIFEADGEVISKPIGSIYETMSDPLKEFPLINPATGGRPRCD